MQNYENEVAELKPKEQYKYLKKYLHYFDTKAQVRLYTTLVMQHPLATGVQRVRCFPFENHKFQGRKKRYLLSIKEQQAPLARPLWAYAPIGKPKLPD
jgi:hypothetical protein